MNKLNKQVVANTNLLRDQANSISKNELSFNSLRMSNSFGNNKENGLDTTVDVDNYNNDSFAASNNGEE